jgi:hypothetical protein
VRLDFRWDTALRDFQIQLDPRVSRNNGASSDAPCEEGSWFPENWISSNQPEQLRTRIMNRKKSITAIAITIAVLAITLALFRKHAESPQIANIAKSATADKQTAAQQSAAGNAVNASPLKVEYASPAPKIAQLQPDPTPPPGKAEVVVGEKSISPPNYNGSYERVAVQSGARVPVQVSWPNDNISAGVYVDAIQGGKIDGQKSKSFDFRSGNTIHFDFTANQEAGLYQVVLRRGTTEEVLEFWVPTNRPQKDPHTLN